MQNETFVRHMALQADFIFQGSGKFKPIFCNYNHPTPILENYLESMIHQ